MRTVYIGDYFEAELGSGTAFPFFVPDLDNIGLPNKFYLPIVKNGAGAGAPPPANPGNGFYFTHPIHPNQSAITWRMYYSSGDQRVAMRISHGPTTTPYPAPGATQDEVYYLLSDHLGSTTVTVNADGTVKSRVRYDAWGKTRYTSGTTPTDRKYTGQIEEATMGLYFYNARWYDASLGRFIQSDTIIPQPGSPLAWDRYAYVNSNPINNIDPTGHMRIAERNDNNRYIQPVIPKPYYYGSGISEDESPSTQLGHTLYYEGGGDNAGIAVNIMQTLHNRAYNAWNCSIEHCNNTEWAKLNPGLIPWEKITSVQYTKMLLYLASTPYTGSAGGVHPAYNGWETPRDIEAFKQNRILSTLFSDLVATSNKWLYTLPGTDPLSAPIVYKKEHPDTPLRNPNVMYFYSTTVDLRDSLQYVHFDRSSDGRYQFYSVVPLP